MSFRDRHCGGARRPVWFLVTSGDKRAPMLGGQSMRVAEGRNVRAPFPWALGCDGRVAGRRRLTVPARWLGTAWCTGGEHQCGVPPRGYPNVMPCVWRDCGVIEKRYRHRGGVVDYFFFHAVAVQRADE